MASCLGKGLYEAKTLASPGLLDFFTYASAREGPWQLKLDNGVGAGWGALFPAGAVTGGQFPQRVLLHMNYDGDPVTTSPTGLP